MPSLPLDQDQPGDASTVSLTIVTGPPCGGKSTYVRDHAATGDIIIDLDRIGLAITTTDIEHHDYPLPVRRVAMTVRDYAIQAALNQADRTNVWIIECAPDRSRYDRHGATYIDCDPGKAISLERASTERPGHVADLIERYYADTEGRVRNA
jgi:hypothetical protein